MWKVPEARSRGNRRKSAGPCLDICSRLGFQSLPEVGRMPDMVSSSVISRDLGPRGCWALAQLRGTYLDEKMRGIESCCHSAHWAGPPAGLWQGEEPFSYLPRGTMDWPQPDPPPFHSHASQRPIGAKNHKGQEQRTSKRKHRPIP